jgi:hypothetical protein
MPTFVVNMHLGYERRPTPRDQAFLGGLAARVQPWGIADLMVVLDVDAADMGAALTRAQDLGSGRGQAGRRAAQCPSDGPGI